MNTAVYRFLRVLRKLVLHSEIGDSTEVSDATDIDEEVRRRGNGWKHTLIWISVVASRCGSCSCSTLWGSEAANIEINNL